MCTNKKPPNPEKMTIRQDDLIKIERCDEKWKTRRQAFWGTFARQGKLWLELGPFISGDDIRFEARVERYEKGCKGRREEVLRLPEVSWRLSRATKFMKVLGAGVETVSRAENSTATVVESKKGNSPYTKIDAPKLCIFIYGQCFFATPLHSLEYA